MKEVKLYIFRYHEFGPLKMKKLKPDAISAIFSRPNVKRATLSYPSESEQLVEEPQKKV